MMILFIIIISLYGLKLLVAVVPVFSQLLVFYLLFICEYLCLADDSVRRRQCCCELIEIHCDFDSVRESDSCFFWSGLPAAFSLLAAKSDGFYCLTAYKNVKFLKRGEVMWPIIISYHWNGWLVKFSSHVGYINSCNRMTHHPQKRRGYGHVTVLKLCPLLVMQRDARVCQRQLSYLLSKTIKIAYIVNNWKWIKTVDNCKIRQNTMTCNNVAYFFVQTQTRLSAVRRFRWHPHNAIKYQWQKWH